MKLKLSILAFGLCAAVLLTVLLGTETGVANHNTIAEYKRGTITEKEHAEYLNVTQFFTPGISKQLNDPEYRKRALREHIAFKILEERGRKITKESQAASAEEQWNSFKKQYDQSFSYNNESLMLRIGKLRLTEANLIAYIEGQIYGSLYLKSTLDKEMLEKDYQLNAQLHNYDILDVSQIQISLKPDGFQTRTYKEALKRANEVIVKLEACAEFTKLAQQYSDDPSLSTNGGQYLDTPIYGFDSDIKQDLLHLPLHQLSKPLRAESGYYIIQIDKKSSLTYAEAMDALMNERVQTAYTDFLTKELPDLIINMDEK